VPATLSYHGKEERKTERERERERFGGEYLVQDAN